MRACDRGGRMLVTTAGAFTAFSLMTIAVGTDYWLYARGVCRSKSAGDNDTEHKNEEVLTHSGLWRTCCMEGVFTGVCKEIDHFLEDADYEQDAAEYLLSKYTHPHTHSVTLETIVKTYCTTGAVRASSLFPILSVGLLFGGGVCVAASEFYKSRHNVILSAGILFVSAANAGDPNQSESKRSHWYGWSFYCGALSFILAETVGVLTVHLFIDTHRRVQAASARPRDHASSLQRRRSSSYRSRYRRRPSRASLHCREATPLWRPALPPANDLLPLYALNRGYTYAAHARWPQDGAFSHAQNLGACREAFPRPLARMQSSASVEDEPADPNKPPPCNLTSADEHALTPLATRRTTPV
ncbi:voltage-dependent calcium channel gamma-3 subunit-like isoform X2 [Denticeps clupeoides]|uniref:voltage-dependent calcium channel gamma-3 subunit-like isoform X2 n=1 Tax=Denticeps clupeoides TaxID=299321 RepID=UPI0010A370B0|nr:voltage-dependent calcium channel gamma-3 subunit-like isoform X2 [Denticeps clupeoides]